MSQTVTTKTEITATGMKHLSASEYLSKPAF